MLGEEGAAAVHTISHDEVNEQGEQAASSVSSGLNHLRRVRRTRTQYEKLERPAGISAGEPIPSIEGWVLFISNLPPLTTAEDVQDLFAGFNPSDSTYFGNIREVKIPLDKDCLCPGYALVELESHEGFERALAELQGYPISFGQPSEDDATRPTLNVAPAFIAEAEEAEDEPAEAIPGDKRTRD